jgi:hypothetical protein
VLLLLLLLLLLLVLLLLLLLLLLRLQLPRMQLLPVSHLAPCRLVCSRHVHLHIAGRALQFPSERLLLTADLPHPLHEPRCRLHLNIWLLLLAVRLLLPALFALLICCHCTALHGSPRCCQPAQVQLVESQPAVLVCGRAALHIDQHFAGAAVLQIEGRGQAAEQDVGGWVPHPRHHSVCCRARQGCVSTPAAASQELCHHLPLLPRCMQQRADTACPHVLQRQLVHLHLHAV